MKSALLIDDQEIFLEGLRFCLEQFGSYRVAGVASETALGLEIAGDLKPDLITLDLRIKDRIDLSIIEELKAVSRNSRILVLTMLDEAIYGSKCIDAGADGFLPKRLGTEGLRSACAALTSGDVYLSPTLTGLMTARKLGKPTDRTHPLAILSTREIEVFQRIGMNLPNRRIATELGVSVKTVESHRERIKIKLDISNGRILQDLAARWIAGDGNIP